MTSFWNMKNLATNKTNEAQLKQAKIYKDLFGTCCLLITIVNIIEV